TGRKSGGPMHGGLSICRRGRGRIDHRPGMGRTGSHLRKRQSARRVAALQPRPATHLLGDRSRTPLAGADAPDQLRADGASSSRCAAAISPDQILDGTRAARPDAPGAPARALPLRSVEPGKARRAMLGGLRNPGARAGDEARRNRHQARGNRCVGRPRLDPGAAGLRTGDGFARLSAREHSRLHNAGVCDLGAHAGASAQPDAAHQMLKDIGHPHRDDAAVYDVAFENVQAGERTSHLFRLANLNGALVVGTGDLSELALGWCTYGVGDQMSHYNVNASVPKTLIQHLIRWVAGTGRLGAEASATLHEILATPISPELVPGGDGAEGPAQDTEAMIGPYELHDFSLYHVLRFGYPPAKVAFLA